MNRRNLIKKSGLLAALGFTSTQVAQASVTKEFKWTTMYGTFDHVLKETNTAIKAGKMVRANSFDTSNNHIEKYFEKCKKDLESYPNFEKGYILICNDYIRYMAIYDAKSRLINMKELT